VLGLQPTKANPRRDGLERERRFFPQARRGGQRLEEILPEKYPVTYLLNR